MAHFDIMDGLIGGSLFLFTGAEAVMDSGSIMEVISNFGVTAILVYWLSDMRKRLDLQESKSEERQDKLIKTFEEENKLLKESHERQLEKLGQDHSIRMASLETIIREQRAELTRIYEAQVLDNKN